MPELPEVEVVAQGLRANIQNKTITSLSVLSGARFHGTKKEITDFVKGKKVSSVDRRAKWLIIWLSSDYGFLIHLKMTGQLLYQKDKPIFIGGHTMDHEKATYPNKHSRVVFNFSDKSQLFFQDIRRFGYVKLLSRKEIDHFFEQKKLGLEPQNKNFTFEYFNTQLKRKPRTTIKAALLDQTIVGGLGNIYVDEACFLAGVRPTRRVNKVTRAERQRLHKAVQQVIKEAIKLGGTSFSDFYQVDGSLGNYWDKRRVYGRADEPCITCSTPIKKTRVAGRGTHYCPSCQK